VSRIAVLSVHLLMRGVWFSYMPDEVQVLVVSATMPPDVSDSSSFPLIVEIDVCDGWVLSRIDCVYLRCWT
jgi:hypothetical protein